MSGSLRNEKAYVYDVLSDGDVSSRPERVVCTSKISSAWTSLVAVMPDGDEPVQTDTASEYQLRVS